MEHIKFIIFGPPFVGKSTFLAFISWLCSQRMIPQIRVFDFETVGYEVEVGYKLEKLFRDLPIKMVCGAGAMPKHEFRMPWKSILYLPEIQEYQRTMAEKKILENKSSYDRFHTNEGALLTYDSYKKDLSFDHVAKNQNELLNIILDYYQLVPKNPNRKERGQS